MTKILLGIALIIGAMMVNHAIGKTIKHLGKKKQVARDRMFYIQKTLQFFIFITVLLLMAIVFGLNYAQFGFVVSSIFAVIGIALFAQWSILSNVTASIIIFFFFPYRVGDRISIREDKDILEGEILEITLFHLLIQREEGDILSYPNSLVFQKAIIIKPKRRIEKKRESDG